MKEGIGIFLWKISVALYLIANGFLGLSKTGGDFRVIFGRMGFGGDTLNLFVTIASIIAFIAGIAIVLEMLGITLSFLDTLILIVAIVWAIYIVINIVTWLTGGFKELWYTLQMLAVHIMVLASLLIASKKFG
jgi:hypothetical protein